MDHSPKVFDFLRDDCGVGMQLCDERHVPSGCAHDHDQLLIVHSLGAVLVQSLVYELTNDFSNACDGNIFKVMPKAVALGRSLECTQLSPPSLQ